jgi:hypothetical protein
MAGVRAKKKKKRIAMVGSRLEGWYRRRGEGDGWDAAPVNAAARRSRGWSGAGGEQWDVAADGARGEPRAPAAGQRERRRRGKKERARVGRACEVVWVTALGPGPARNNVKLDFPETPP